MAATGLALSLSFGVLGCGGSKEASDENLAAADAAPPAAAAPAPAPEAAPAPAPAAGTEAAKAEPAPAEPAEPKSNAQNAADTDDLLAAARSSANADAAASNSSSGSPPASGSGSSSSGSSSGAPAASDSGSSSSSSMASAYDHRPTQSSNPNAAMEAAIRGQQGGSSSSSGAPSSSSDPSAAMRAAYAQSGQGSSSSSGGDSSSSSSSSYGEGGQPLAPGEDSKSGGPYENPINSAKTFLAAIKAKDPDKLADAVALRSISEMEGATQKHQSKYFKPILERSVEQDTLDELAAMFEGMQIVGKNNPKSTGELGVILGKTAENKFVQITLYTRKEKAGWKVKDFSQTRVTDHNPYAAPKMPTGRMPARGRRR
jgi:hypothetical protein